MTGSETSAGAPATAEPRTVTDEGNAAPEAPIPFRQFLEAIHPSVERNVSGLWHESTSSLGGQQTRMSTPDLHLHCERCDGMRLPRAKGDPRQLPEGAGVLDL
jgi:hypothetical protein